MNSFAIAGMTCNGCLRTVTSALAGVWPEVRVTLDPPRAVFPTASPTQAEVSLALAGTGNYSATPDVSDVALVATGTTPATAGFFATYRPLLLIILYLAIVSLAGSFATDGFDAEAWMLHFMAGFFLVFSFFKLLDLEGFADAFASYDLLAGRWRAYGLVYPFLELALGIVFLFGWQLQIANVATILLMGFGSLGVLRALMRRQTIRCACLGTVLNLPMSTVTLVEDGAMVAMAIAMLAGGH